jgi:hypothetical protein
MNTAILSLTGVYIAYPTSPALKSINRAKHYMAAVNDRHTKVGVTYCSFQSRRSCYLANFDNEIEFVPVAAMDPEDLPYAHLLILEAVGTFYDRVGDAREWFKTAHRQRITGIVVDTLNEHGIKFRLVCESV